MHIIQSNRKPHHQKQISSKTNIPETTNIYIYIYIHIYIYIYYRPFCSGFLHYRPFVLSLLSDPSY